jgi:hypothetical protein
MFPHFHILPFPCFRIFIFSYFHVSVFSYFRIFIFSYFHVFIFCTVVIFIQYFLRNSSIVIVYIGTGCTLFRQYTTATLLKVDFVTKLYIFLVLSRSSILSKLFVYMLILKLVKLYRGAVKGCNDHEETTVSTVCKSNRMFSCEQHCNIVPQYCNFDRGSEWG